MSMDTRCSILTKSLVPKTSAALRLLALLLPTLLLSGCATGLRGTGGAGELGSPGEGAAHGCQTPPPGWPDLSSSDSAALLEPFLACASPSEFVQLQRRVDMVRLVNQLDDWSAVRLGAMGPLPEPAARVLDLKRAAFLVEIVHMNGTALAEVFALFILHSTCDSDMRQVLEALARDRRLGRTLGDMSVVREQLEARGLPLSDFPERPERPVEDAARGALESLGDAMSTPMTQAGQSLIYAQRAQQLPQPYRRALEQVQNALVEHAWRTGQGGLGAVDELMFGVPLGIYALGVGMSQGASALREHRYEQAARELTPAVLMVALYAGGKGLGALSEAGGWEGLRGTAQRLREQLGAAGVESVARYLEADREAVLFVVEGGEQGALALHEARGNVPEARAWLSQAKGEGPGSSPRRGGGASVVVGSAALVEVAGVSQEVWDARLLEGDLEATGPRLSGDLRVLKRQLAALREKPPAGAQAHRLWDEYVRYGEERLAELERGGEVRKGKKQVEPPLQWEGYQRMRGLVTRGLAFERAMAEVLREDAALPRAQRCYLGDFEQPRVETFVGVWKEASGLRFADVLVIEEKPSAGRPPRVETFSFKSRDFSLMEEKDMRAQMRTDASDALRYYGEMLDIRRPSLQSLLRTNSEVAVARTRLIYEGNKLRPAKLELQRAAITVAGQRVPEVEISFQ